MRDEPSVGIVRDEVRPSVSGNFTLPVPEPRAADVTSVTALRRPRRAARGLSALAEPTEPGIDQVAQSWSGGATPIWFGPEDRPAFGWVHAPSDLFCRAGAVICPPLGLDYLDTHYALRALAERLATMGISALRFDYDGTGDSAGSYSDPERVISWVRTVLEGIEVLRSAGAPSICLVGMGTGAALAAAAAARAGEVDQLVYWDPCSGKRFLREERAIAGISFGVGDGADGVVDIPGVRLSPETTAALRELTPNNLTLPLARRALVLSRPSRTEACFLMPSLGREHTEIGEALGQELLLAERVTEPQLPMETIGTLSRWLEGGAPHASARLVLPSPAGPRLVAQTSTGGRVVEVPVSIPPLGLFGMLSRPEDEMMRRGPMIVILNNWNWHHVGPARLWVDFARAWAAKGMASVRLDLSGLGDSPSRPGDDRWVCNKLSAFDDVIEAAHNLSPTAPSNVVLVGLCSGGYQALESALELGAVGVVALNPGITFVPPERRAGLKTDARRRVVLPKDDVPGVWRKGGRFGRLRERYPGLAWRARTLAFPGNRAGAWLGELARQGSRTLIVCGDREIRPIAGSTAPGALRRLRRNGVFVEEVRGLQHELFVLEQRVAVTELVTDFLFSNFCS